MIQRVEAQSRSLHSDAQKNIVFLAWIFFAIHHLTCSALAMGQQISQPLPGISGFL